MAWYQAMPILSQRLERSVKIILAQADTRLLLKLVIIKIIYMKTFLESFEEEHMDFNNSCREKKLSIEFTLNKTFKGIAAFWSGAHVALKYI